MQGRTAQPNGPGPRSYVPPVTPSVPPTIGQLVPRLRGAINDIDIFQNMVAQGAIDASMPSWDALLRQYSLLTARLNALSTHLSTLHSPSPHLPPPSTTSAPPRPSGPIPLDQALITPLNPLPVDSTPLAQGAFFEALNTMPLFPLQQYTSDLLAHPPSDPSHPTEQRDHTWRSAEELRAMDQTELERLRDDFRARLSEQHATADALSAYIEDKVGEYTWDTRVDEEGEADDVEGADHRDDEGDDDDLFGEKEDQAPKPQSKPLETKDRPNPRAGWTLSDYIAYIDTGRRAPTTRAS